MNTAGAREQGTWWPVVFFALAVLGVLYLVRSSLPPLILAGIMAYLLNPLVDMGERRGLARWVTITIIYAVIGALLVLTVAYLVPLIVGQLQDVQRQLKTLWPKLPGYLDATVQWAQQRFPAIAPTIGEIRLTDRAIGALQEWFAKALEQSPALLKSAFLNLVNILSYFVMVPFIAFFLLRDGRQFKRALIALVPNQYFEVTLGVIGGVGESVGRYLRGLLLEALILAIVATIGLLIIGLQQAALVGLVAGVTNLIPYLGPIMGVLVGCLVALTTGGSVLGVLVVFAVAQFLDNWIVQPVVMSRSVRLHPLLVFLAVVFGGTYAGLLGMILAVPLTGAMVVTLRTLREGLRPPVYPHVPA